MCKYADIESFKLFNGKSIKRVNEKSAKKWSNIYLEKWDKEGNYYHYKFLDDDLMVRPVLYRSF